MSLGRLLKISWEKAPPALLPDYIEKAQKNPKEVNGSNDGKEGIGGMSPKPALYRQMEGIGGASGGRWAISRSYGILPFPSPPIGEKKRPAGPENIDFGYCKPRERQPGFALYSSLVAIMMRPVFIRLHLTARFTVIPTSRITRITSRSVVKPMRTQTGASRSSIFPRTPPLGLRV